MNKSFMLISKGIAGPEAVDDVGPKVEEFGGASYGYGFENLNRRKSVLFPLFWLITWGLLGTLSYDKDAPGPGQFFLLLSLLSLGGIGRFLYNFFSVPSFTLSDGRISWPRGSSVTSRDLHGLAFTLAPEVEDVTAIESFSRDYFMRQIVNRKVIGKRIERIKCWVRVEASRRPLLALELSVDDANSLCLHLGCYFDSVLCAPRTWKDEYWHQSPKEKNSLFTLGMTRQDYGPDWQPRKVVISIPEGETPQGAGVTAKDARYTEQDELRN